MRVRPFMPGNWKACRLEAREGCRHIVHVDHGHVETGLAVLVLGVCLDLPPCDEDCLAAVGRQVPGTDSGTVEGKHDYSSYENVDFLVARYVT